MEQAISARLGDVEIPDYVGHFVDTAMADAVQRDLGIPKMVDGRGRRVRVMVLADWKVVRQTGVARSMVFEVTRASP